jgi:DNA polymerase-3 subunit alpha
VPILPPDVNESQLNFSVEPGKGVRFGLTAIKGLGEGAINAIMGAREQLGGRIRSLHQLCEILDMRLANKRVFEALVKSGACDSLIPEVDTLATGLDQKLGAAIERNAHLARWRARLFAAIDAACEHGARQQRNKDLGQFDMFGGGEVGQAGPADTPLPDATPWTEIEQLNFEKESLGLYWSGHPIDRYAADLREYGAKTTAELNPKREEDDEAPAAADAGAAGDAAPPATGAHPGRNGRMAADETSIGGIVSGLRPLKTRKGDRMCVFMLDDASGSLEIVVFPETFKQFGHLAENGQMVLVKGKFERDDESARILASEIQPIDMVRERLAKAVAIRLTTPPHDRRTFEQLWDVFAQHKGDRRVAFDVEVREADRHYRVKVDVNAQIRVRPSERLVSEVEKIVGVGSVSLR